MSDPEDVLVARLVQTLAYAAHSEAEIDADAPGDRAYLRQVWSDEIRMTCAALEWLGCKPPTRGTPDDPA